MPFVNDKLKTYFNTDNTNEVTLNPATWTIRTYAMAILMICLFAVFILLLATTVTTDKIQTENEYTEKKESISALLFTSLGILILGIIFALYLYYSYSNKVNKMWNIATGFSIIGKN